MHFKAIFILICIIGYVPTLKANSMPALLKRLSTLSGHVQVFCYSRDLPFSMKDLPEGFQRSGFGIVKNPSGLYVLPQGTGRVYRYQTELNQWQRVDSTFFNGYNFGSLAFTLGNDLYSYGGYGIWQINGVLRRYNYLAGEWNAVSTNRYIPWKLKHTGWANFYFLDTLKGTLIINGLGISGIQTIKNQADPEIGTDLYELDIRNGDWRKLGRFRDTALELIGILPWGILDAHGGVADVPNNRYLKLSGESIAKLQAIAYKALQSSEFLLSFCYDSTLYFSRDPSRFDSLIISRSDLINTHLAVYEPFDYRVHEILSGIRQYGWFALAVSAGFLAGLLMKRRKLARPVHTAEKSLAELEAEEQASSQSTLTQAVAESPEKTPAEKPILFRSSRLLELLEEKERSLLEFIYLYSEEERLTTIDEINKVIGAGSRSPEIQKRMRSDLIGSINQKMALITKDKKPVIDKQRSEFDKRSFEYFVRNEYLELVARVLGNK
jgi:hypothetical protein